MNYVSLAKYAPTLWVGIKKAIKYGGIALKAVPTAVKLLKATQLAVQAVEKETHTAKDIIVHTSSEQKQALAFTLIYETVPKPKWIPDWYWECLIRHAIDSVVSFYNRRLGKKFGKHTLELLNDAL